MQYQSAQRAVAMGLVQGHSVLEDIPPILAVTSPTFCPEQQEASSRIFDGYPLNLSSHEVRDIFVRRLVELPSEPHPKHDERLFNADDVCPGPVPRKLFKQTMYRIGKQPEE